MSGRIFIGQGNIVTPLGFSTEENFGKLLSGKSGISRHQNNWLPNAYFASIIDDASLNKAFADISANVDFTKLEKMMILALQPVVAQSGSDLNKKTAFILSTTKGNITALEKSDLSKATLHQLAKTIADFFGFQSEPIVISNACVSGIMAVSAAKRLMQSGMYDDAFVVAGDLVSEFVLSGFNSFQAMSDAPCKPYSKNRTGVTLGEAAAAVYITKKSENASAEILGDGSMNDANHISGPSRTGEGLFLSVESAMKEAGIPADSIGFISAHGTATPFNDEMEAIAFNRLHLQNIPLHSLKGYYGHTLGASGLLEAIIGIEAMNRGQLIASAGFDEIGVSENINVIDKNSDAKIDYFLKTASGFGGCNTAVVFGKVNLQGFQNLVAFEENGLAIEDYLTISNGKIVLNDAEVFASDASSFADFSKEALRHFGIQYPKFFKMDNLSKLAFLGSELLLKDLSDKEKTALLFANASSSLDTDINYQSSISDKENYFPSPAVFVYTLPNICLGEISIRHQLKTENSFFIFGAFNPEFMFGYAENLIQTQKAESVLCGWTELLGEQYKAFLYVVSKHGKIAHRIETLKELYQD